MQIFFTICQEITFINITNVNYCQSSLCTENYSCQCKQMSELNHYHFSVSAIKTTCHILNSKQFSTCNNYESARHVCNGTLAKRIFRFLLPTVTVPGEFKWHNAMLSHLITLVQHTLVYSLLSGSLKNNAKQIEMYNAPEARTFMAKAKCNLIIVYMFIVHYHKIS